MFKIPEENINTALARYISYEQMNLINTIRQYYFAFAMWGFAYADALINRSGLADAVYTRLLRIPFDIYQLISTYYGRQAAERVMDLQSRFVIIYRSLIEAMLSGDTANADQSLRQLYQNADERADFIASLNPYWSREQWRNLHYQFIQLLYSSAFAIMTKNYEQGINLFERTCFISSLIADYLSRGLIATIQAPTVPGAGQE